MTISRLKEETGYQKISTIKGQGNTSTRHNYFWLDTRVQYGITYWYKLSDVTIYGLEFFHKPICITLIKTLPMEFYLNQNYPNPFNSGTSISYNLSAVSNVEFKIYNMLGQNVYTLSEEKQPPGYYNLKVDFPNFPGGIYVYKIKAGKFVDSKKMVLIK